MRTLATAAAVLALAAVPAAAEGATFFNGSSSKGAYVTTASRQIDTLQIFCSGRSNETRQLRYDTPELIDIGRRGKFSYSGIAYAYGPDAEPRGEPKIKLSGHLAGSKSVSIRWTVPDCGSGVSVASVKR